MSRMKTYVENVSVGLGFDGVVDEYVCNVAQVMMNAGVPSACAEKSAKSWAGHPDCAPLPPEKPIDLKQVKVRNLGKAGFDIVVIDPENPLIIRHSLIDQALADRVQAAIDNYVELKKPTLQESHDAMLSELRIIEERLRDPAAVRARNECELVDGRVGHIQNLIAFAKKFKGSTE